MQQKVIRKRVLTFIRCVDDGSLYRTHEHLATYLEISKETVRRMMAKDGVILGMRFRYETRGQELPSGGEQKCG